MGREYCETPIRGSEERRVYQISTTFNNSDRIHFIVSVLGAMPTLVVCMFSLGKRAMAT
jgi:hypothetical protein